MDIQKIILDGIHWYIPPSRDAQPLCPKHNLRLTVNAYSGVASHYLYCAECKEPIYIPREYLKQKQYIIDKTDSKAFKTMKVINLDDEAIPIAEDKAGTKDGKFFVTARLMESKVGKRLVIYAGEKGKKEKCQIFVEPEIKRLSFDQKDLHPNDVFLEIQAKFKDGSIHQIKTN